MEHKIHKNHTIHNYIYIHVCCINNWKDVLHLLYFNIKSSGLHDAVTRIKCNVLCAPESKADVDVYFSKLLLFDAKLELLGITCDLLLYETPTINLLHDHAIKIGHDDDADNFNVLYLHTKGVTRNSVNVVDWINYMIYFNIHEYKTCIDHLTNHGYDTVGVNLFTTHPIHYSGNFWWARSSYLKKLKRCEVKHYNSPEFWLTEDNLGKFSSLWHSNINHYNQRYEEHNYKIVYNLQK
jgi:hypothetical protein